MRVTGVSFSSDRKLKHCEAQYSYRYDQQLKVKVKSKGLYMGDYLHQLYEAYYCRLKDRKMPTWQSVFEQVKKKLWDNLFEEERERYEENGFTPALAYDLMSHYVEHWSAQDTLWRILEIEKSYELQSRAGFPVRFKSDLIVQEGKSIILVETKNKKEIPSAKERILEPQVHSYCYLLSKVGIRIDRICWNYIRTSPVPQPQVLKDGSLSKRKINTDQRNYLAALKKAGIHPKGEEIIGLENHLKTLPMTLALERVYNTPNLKIGEMFVREWVERAKRAQKITKPLHNWGRDCSYMCEYHQLCQVDMLGNLDRNTLIKRDFVLNIKPAEEELK